MRPATVHNPFGPVNPNRAPEPAPWDGPTDLDAALHAIPAVAALNPEAYTTLRTGAADHLHTRTTRTAFAEYITHALTTLH
ncbi:hypothetical protein GCM10012320_32800 [Sinomonas cellulolyticus]|uniref:Uncharacterized protein n=1 Tax=Sinomonas cellulolyticus TaxID=2801916 RepID=A0ABS1JXM4_9MICC|nr:MULTISPECIES: hypothetical protein [Sinomonas]MBL0703974.1 hypothetical protein [Sinomonas cellulolyticus]GHG58974.1 hypothetical protein GCM10012320_32800 [Sinomonas sp. KCTC 49339]